MQKITPLLAAALTLMHIHIKQSALTLVNTTDREEEGVNTGGGVIYYSELDDMAEV